MAPSIYYCLGQCCDFLMLRFKSSTRISGFSLRASTFYSAESARAPEA